MIKQFASYFMNGSSPDSVSHSGHRRSLGLYVVPSILALSFLAALVLLIFHSGPGSLSYVLGHALAAITPAILFYYLFRGVSQKRHSAEAQQASAHSEEINEK